MLAVYCLAKPKPHFMMRGSFEKVINWMGDGRQRKLVILRINTLKCANFLSKLLGLELTIIMYISAAIYRFMS